MFLCGAAVADDLRTDADRRRRLFASGLMEPTDRNRRAWDEVHRRRARAMQGQLGLPAAVRAALGDLDGTPRAAPAVRRPASRRPSSRSSARSSPASTSRARRSRSRASAGPTSPGSRPTSTICRRSCGAAASTSSTPATACSSGCSTSTRGPAGSRRRCAAAATSSSTRSIPSRCASTRACAGARTTSTRSCTSTSGWSHFELGGAPASEEKVERFWRLGQVVSAIARSGLVVTQLEEYPEHAWRHLPSRVPGSFILLARKP